jgi:hypothetical protein
MSALSRSSRRHSGAQCGFVALQRAAAGGSTAPAKLAPRRCQVVRSPHTRCERWRSAALALGRTRSCTPAPIRSRPRRSLCRRRDRPKRPVVTTKAIVSGRAIWTLRDIGEEKARGAGRRMRRCQRCPSRRLRRPRRGCVFSTFVEGRASAGADTVLPLACTVRMPGGSL